MIHDLSKERMERPKFFVEAHKKKLADERRAKKRKRKVVFLESGYLVFAKPKERHAANDLLATLNIVPTPLLTVVAYLYRLDTRNNSGGYNRLEKHVLLNKNPGVKDAFHVFRMAMVEKYDIILPNFSIRLAKHS